MKITRAKIIGIGLRKKGVGQNGRPYDFVEVCFTYPTKKFDGVGCGTCVLDGSDLDDHKLVPGCEVNCFIGHKKVSEWDYRPYIIGIAGRV